MGGAAERPGGGEPLALAGRQVARVARLRACETDSGEHLPRAQKIGAKRNLLVGALAHEVAARILEEHRRGPAANDSAGLRLEQSCDELRERRLPRAVRPGERDDLPAA